MTFNTVAFFAPGPNARPRNTIIPRKPTTVVTFLQHWTEHLSSPVASTSRNSPSQQRDRHPAPAVVPGTIRIFHMRTPGHTTANPDSAASNLTPTSAMHHHPAPRTLPPTQHLHLGRHHQLLFLRPLEQDPMQLLQNTRRRTGFPGHDHRKMTGADTGPSSNLVLTKPMSIPPTPRSFTIDAGTLRRRDLRGSLQRRRDPRMDLHAHVPATTRHLRHIAGSHPHAFSQVASAGISPSRCGGR